MLNRYLFLLAVQVSLWCATSTVAMAAPGGLIKAAARSPIVQLLFAIAVVVVLPLIIWWTIKYQKMLGRTKMDLNRLAGAHPQYSWLNLKDRVLETAQWVWSGWEEKKMSRAAIYTTNWYWQNQQLVIDRWERNGLENVCELKQIIDVTPLHVSHVDTVDADGSRVVVLVKAQVIDYMREVDSGKILQGDTNEGELESVWTFMWQDGRWKLNLIEAGEQEFAYLRLPNVLPEMNLGSLGKTA